MRHALLRFVWCLPIGLSLSVVVALACARWSRPHGPESVSVSHRSAHELSLPAHARERSGDLKWLAKHGLERVEGSYWFDTFRGAGAEWMFATYLPGDGSGETVARRYRVGWPFDCLEDARLAGRDDADRRSGSAIDVPYEYYAVLDAADPRFAGSGRVGSRSCDLTEGRVIPIKPLWIGLLLNTLLYAFAIWFVAFMPGSARRLIRDRGGQCLHCGYSLKGIDSVRCPECGETSVFARKGRKS